MNLSKSLIYLIGVFIASCAQILLKKGAKRKYANLMREYFNSYVLAGYTLFFTSTFITIYALSVIDLSFGAALEAVGYIFIALLSYFFLHEKSNLKQILGYCMIILGVFMFNIL